MLLKPLMDCHPIGVSPPMRSSTQRAAKLRARCHRRLLGGRTGLAAVRIGEAESALKAVALVTVVHLDLVLLCRVWSTELKHITCTSTHGSQLINYPARAKTEYMTQAPHECMSRANSRKLICR